MSYYSDRTGNTAAGNLDRELRQMKKEAEWLAYRQSEGLLTYEEIVNARRRFTGIYRPLLRKAIGV